MSSPTLTPAASEHPVSSLFLLLALLAGHTFSSMAVLVLPAVAPEVARDYGFDPSLIGYQISLVSVGMVFTLTLLGSTSRRYGAARTNQLGHALVAVGMLVLLLPWTVFLIIGSVVIGLGYGMITPSASHLLMRFTPPERRSTMFSLHQVGIPAGGMCAALISPAVAIYAGWRWAVIVSVLLLVGVVVLMQRERRRWDDDRDAAAPAITANPLAGAIAIWGQPQLRLIAIAGGCFSWIQFCAATFAVVACVITLDMSLVVAGTVLTVVQLASAGGRVLMGWIVDRVGDTARALAWNAGILIASTVAALALDPALPLIWVYVLFAVMGATSGCWPGVILAEVGRLAPQGQVSLAISGSLVITNVGKFAGPIIFANVYVLTRSYGIAFASLIVPAAVALYCLL
ncbi:MAG: MFS transporter, partial [Betaproteobacteria bacterium]|nr:MFS transporter [Betaproteobacteria bacterium]